MTYSARLLDEYGDEKYMFKEGSDRCLATGPRRVRSCTDVVWLVLFLVCMTVFYCLSILGFAEGNTEVLDVYVHPIDHNKHSCGLKDMIDFKYVFFSPIIPPTPNKTELLETFGVINSSVLLTPVCTNVCPSWSVPPVCSDDDHAYCDWTKVDHRVNTTAVGHYCLDADMVSDWLTEVGNLQNSWPVLLVGFLLVIVLGFVFLFVLKMCTGVIFGTIIGASITMFIVMGTIALAQKQHVMETKRVTSASVVGFAVWCYIMSALLTIFALVYRNTIRVSIRMLETAAMFMMDVKSSMVQPVFFSAFHILFTLAWIGCSVALWTVDATSGTCCHTEKRTQSTICLVDYINPFCVEHNSDYGFVFVTFMIIFFLWVQGMISALSHFTTAYAAGVWYFAGTNEEGERALPGGNTFCDWRLTFRGMRIGTWYHTGTFAFGALLCAVCKIILCIMRSSTQEQHPGSSIQGCLLACTACCASCVERFIAFITKQAYIQTALLGTGFCESGKSALSISVRHPMRTAMTYKSSTLIEVVGATAISASTVGIGYCLMNTSMVHGVNNFTPGLAVLFVMALVMSLTMMHPYSTATMAIMHCFAADEEMSRAVGLCDARHTPEPLLALLRDQSGEPEGA